MIGRALLAARTAVVLAVVLAPGSAAAGDSAAAEVLFVEARALVQQGNYERACPKLEESQRLDAGMGTLYNLGDCYEHTGRTASAWAAFVEVASLAKAANQKAREADARARAAALEPKLAKLVVQLSKGAAAIASLEVRKDSIERGRPQLGSPVPIDPGRHVISASAPGRRPWQTEVVVLPLGATLDVVVPPLELAPVATSSTTTDPARSLSSDEQGARDDARERGVGSAQRTTGLVLAGLGVVGIGMGTFFGLRSISTHSDADPYCDADNLCSREGVDIRNDARAQGNVSTIAFVAGGALLVGGGFLFFSAPRAKTQARTSLVPTLGYGLAGMSMTGRF